MLPLFHNLTTSCYHQKWSLIPVKLFVWGYLLIFIIFSRNSGTHIGLPEDEASAQNSPSFPLPSPYAAKPMKLSQSCECTGVSAQVWPDGRPLWNQGMMLKEGAVRSPAASLPACVHWDRAEAQPRPQGLGNALGATLRKIFLNHQFGCNVPLPAGRLVVITQPQVPVVKVVLQNAFCTVLTTVHHIYRVLMSPLTLRHFLRNLCLDAMDCSVKNIHKAVFRWGKLAGPSRFQFQWWLNSNFKTVHTV